MIIQFSGWAPISIAKTNIQQQYLDMPTCDQEPGVLNVFSSFFQLCCMLVCDFHAILLGHCSPFVDSACQFSIEVASLILRWFAALWILFCVTASCPDFSACIMCFHDADIPHSMLVRCMLRLRASPGYLEDLRTTAASPDCSCTTKMERDTVNGSSVYVRGSPSLVVVAQPSVSASGGHNQSLVGKSV